MVFFFLLMFNVSNYLYKYNKSATKKCRLCNGHSQETIAHILFECTVTKTFTGTQWNEMKGF
jgi:hypothetical protein